MLVRPLSDDDRHWKLATLERTWGATSVARLGELVDAAGLPGFVAVDNERRVGLLTFRHRRDGIEVVTIATSVARHGIGRALMDAVLQLALERGVDRIWLVTTNDNEAAIAFYRAWGMTLERLVTDGVAASRLVKPTIPMFNGITPLRDELVFERQLTGSCRRRL